MQISDYEKNFYEGKEFEGKFHSIFPDELIQRFIKRSSNEEILKKSERNCRRR